MKKLTIEVLRKCAKDAGKQLIFNRALFGYQIKNGFNCSEVESAGRDCSGKLFINENQIKKLMSYI